MECLTAAFTIDCIFGTTALELFDRSKFHLDVCCGGGDVFAAGRPGLPRGGVTADDDLSLSNGAAAANLDAGRKSENLLILDEFLLCPVELAGWSGMGVRTGLPGMSRIGSSSFSPKESFKTRLA